MMANPHRRGRRDRLVATAAVSVISAFILAACGGGDSSSGGDRPSVEDIEDVIAKSSGGQVTEEQAACLAKTYYESDLSDEAVRLLVEAEDVATISPKDLSEADQKVTEKLYDPLVKCLSSAE